MEASGRIEEAVEVSDKARFDVFISYGSKDVDVVRALAEKLTDRGLRVWFDQWELRPGDSVVRARADAVASAASILVCIGRSGASQWLEKDLAEIMALHEQQNQLIIPVLLPESNSDQMPSILSAYHFLDLRRGLTDEGIARLLSSLTRRRRKS